MTLSDLIALAEPLGWIHSSPMTGVVMFVRAGKRFEVTLSASGRVDEIVSLYADGRFTGPFEKLNQELRKVIE